MSEAALLPGHATAWMRALETVGAERRPLDWNVIRRVWDPAVCPAEFLPFLANALSVDIYLEAWSEERKRHVIGRAIEDHRLKGTLDGLLRYLGYVDAGVRRVVVPPQPFFLSGLPDRAAERAWRAGLPEIRIETVLDSGLAANALLAGGDPLVPAEGFLGAEGGTDDASDDVATFFAGPDVSIDTRLRATLHVDGEVLAIGITSRPDPRHGETGRVFDLAFAGSAGLGLFLGDALSADGALDGSPDAGRLVSIKVAPGAAPPVGEEWDLVSESQHRIQDVRPAEVAIPRVNDAEGFADWPLQGYFLSAPDPEPLRYRSLRLLRGVLQTPNASFLTADRLGMARFTAEAVTELFEPALAGGLYLGPGFVGAGHAHSPTDDSRVRIACDAAVAAKAVRDTVYLDLNLDTPRSLRRGRAISALKL